MTYFGRQLQRACCATWIDEDVPSASYTHRSSLAYGKRLTELLCVAFALFGSVVVYSYAAELTDEDLANDVILTLVFAAACDLVVTVLRRAGRRWRSSSSCPSSAPATSCSTRRRPSTR